MDVKLQLLVILGTGFSATTAINFPSMLPNLSDDGPECPDIPAISDFNLNRYAGTWYEVQKFNTTMLSNSKCASYVHATSGDNGLTVDYRRVVTLMGRTFDVSSRGTFSRHDLERPNLFSVVIQKLKFLNYFIVETDYDRYSVVYTCSKLPGLPRVEMGWILSRDKQSLLSADEMSSLSTRIADVGIDTSRFITSSQTSCEANFIF
ncbi:apolipoprotein D-like [Pecten maximus]|uniref:apolipoprotein D-like n=1 Tax=Pecten maximus TaxID=6579 RepID=UPI001458BEBF|nr:apolipoprotein D-like [Pecten maximus]